MNFLLDGGISVTQPLAMGQDDGRQDHLVRSHYTGRESEKPLGGFPILHRRELPCRALSESHSNEKASCPRTPTRSQTPLEFHPDQSKQCDFVACWMWLTLFSLLAFREKPPTSIKQNTLRFNTHSFPLSGQRRKPKHISPSGRLHSWKSLSDSTHMKRHRAKRRHVMVTLF